VSHLPCWPWLQQQQIYTCIMVKANDVLHPIFYYVAYTVHPTTCQCKHRRGVNIKLYSLISGPDGVGGQSHAPAALPSGKTQYPMYRRLGGPQSRSGRVRKISPTTGIRSPDRPARSESLPYSEMQLCNKIHSHVLNLFLREHLNTAVSS
jgi:hypothetical protein